MGVLLIGIGLFALQQLSRINASTIYITESVIPWIRATTDIHQTIGGVRRYELGILVANNAPERQNGYFKVRDELQGKFIKQLDDYAPMVSSDSEAALYRTIKNEWQQYQQLSNQSMMLVKAGNLQEAHTVLLDGFDPIDPDTFSRLGL